MGEIRDSLGLTADEWAAEYFETMYCEECGGDVEDHDYILLLGIWFARCRMRSIHILAIIADECSFCGEQVNAGEDLFLYRKHGVRLAWCSKDCAQEMGAAVPIL